MLARRRASQLMNHNVISRNAWLCSDYALPDLPSADPARLPWPDGAMQVLCLLCGSLPPETVQCICDIIASAGEALPDHFIVIPVYRNERAVTITYDKIVAMCQKDLPLTNASSSSWTTGPMGRWPSCWRSASATPRSGSCRSQETSARWPPSWPV
jgi:hypothetical protein